MAGPAAAHDGHRHPPRPADLSPAAWVAIDLPDVTLVDHDGRARRLRSELVGDRVAVINFVFTSCTTVCPMLSASMAQVQARVGARLGRDVTLLSLSVDPARDTPARLRSYRAKLSAGPGWPWLTGPQAQVDALLRIFGAWTPNYQDHPPMVLVGDARTGQFLRLNGFPSPDQVLDAIDHVNRSRARAAGS